MIAQGRIHRPSKRRAQRGISQRRDHGPCRDTGGPGQGSRRGADIRLRHRRPPAYGGDKNPFRRSDDKRGRSGNSRTLFAAVQTGGGKGAGARPAFAASVLTGILRQARRYPPAALKFMIRPPCSEANASCLLMKTLSGPQNTAQRHFPPLHRTGRPL